MEITIIYGVLGFLFAAYAVIANDSAQTLGTFISSNKDSKWYWQWLVMCTIMICTLSYSYFSGDITQGRLNSIPLPGQFEWYHLAASTLLLVLTRVGIPVSTTILTLSVFSSSVILEKILLKSAFGYAISAVSAYILWTVITQIFRETKPLKDTNITKWRTAQWCATGFLWSQWLGHDIANVAVFLPRGAELPIWMFMSFLVILAIGLAHLFYTHGGKIQNIVSSKSGVSYVRSATIIDFVYAIILWYFKHYNDIPMSTTWVFVGLLCGRELAVYRYFKKDNKLKIVFPLLLADFLKMMIGLAFSILLIWFIA